MKRPLFALDPYNLPNVTFKNDNFFCIELSNPKTEFAFAFAPIDKAQSFDVPYFQKVENENVLVWLGTVITLEGKRYILSDTQIAKLSRLSGTPLLTSKNIPNDSIERCKGHKDCIGICLKPKSYRVEYLSNFQWSCALPNLKDLKSSFDGQKNKQSSDYYFVI